MLSPFIFLSFLPLFVHSAPPPRYNLVSQLGVDSKRDGLSSVAPSSGAETVFFLPAEALPPLPQISESSNSGPLVMAYYPDWVGDTFPPERIDFSRFDWIDFAFAMPTKTFSLGWDDPDSAPALLTRLVKCAHAAGKKVKLSIGGWTGSKYFSAAVSTGDSRQVFASNIVACYNAFGLDGIDIDWEYPGEQGNGGNLVHPDDSANFLLFLKLLRTMLPPSARMSSAAQCSPFTGPDGQSMADVSGFASVLDWVLIMNYDVWGSSANPGPNAPLYDACHDSTQPDANAVSAYNAWTKAGFPASKLVLGLPSYGYVSKSTATSLRTRSEPRLPSLPRDASSSSAQGPMVNVVADDGGEGQVQFRELVRQGALVRSGDGTSFVGAGGFEQYWDDCSSTPFLRSAPAGQVITYDDPRSLGMKAAFAKKVGMLGVNMFDVHGDTDTWDLIDVVRASMGL